MDLIKIGDRVKVVNVNHISTVVDIQNGYFILKEKYSLDCCNYYSKSELIKVKYRRNRLKDD